MENEQGSWGQTVGGRASLNGGRTAGNCGNDRTGTLCESSLCFTVSRFVTAQKPRDREEGAVVSMHLFLFQSHFNQVGLKQAIQRGKKSSWTFSSSYISFCYWRNAFKFNQIVGGNPIFIKLFLSTFCCHPYIQSRKIPRIIFSPNVNAILCCHWCFFCICLSTMCCVNSLKYLGRKKNQCKYTRMLKVKMFAWEMNNLFSAFIF